MNDLHEVLKITTLSTYADDTQIFYAGNNEVELEQAISTDLKRVDEWFDKNKMQRNPANTQLLYLAIYELAHQDLYAKIQLST